MNAADRNATELAAICRRLERHDSSSTDEESFRVLVEGAAAAGQIGRLACATARFYAPAEGCVADYMIGKAKTPAPEA